MRMQSPKVETKMLCIVSYILQRHVFVKYHNMFRDFKAKFVLDILCLKRLQLKIRHFNAHLLIFESSLCGGAF